MWSKGETAEAGRGEGKGDYMRCRKVSAPRL